MIFLIQRYLEDRFDASGLADPDQYAVQLANLFFQERVNLTEEDFLSRLHRLRTVFYRRNKELDRKAFERRLLKDLDRKYKKKQRDNPSVFPGGIPDAERARITGKRVTISSLLRGFRRLVEAQGVKSFWVSRTRGELKKYPEEQAQTLLVFYLKTILRGRGLVLREFASGTGFVDMGVVLSRVLHLLELKILADNNFQGIEQLATYMSHEERDQGWLVVFDARIPSEKGPLPSSIAVDGGRINVSSIDINPIAPSKRGLPVQLPARG